MGEQPVGDGCRHDRAYRDGHQRGNAIGAEDRLERVESAGERRIESGGDRARRAAADQQAHIDAARAKPAAEQRSDHAAHLGIGGLQPDRSAKAVGNQRLQADVEASPRRQSAAMQRIGLDRVGEPAAKPVLRPEPEDGERSRRRATGMATTRQDCGTTVMLRNARLAGSGRKSHAFSARRRSSRRRSRPLARADDGGDDEQAAFAPAHEGPHPEREKIGPIATARGGAPAAAPEGLPVARAQTREISSSRFEISARSLLAGALAGF